MGLTGQEVGRGVGCGSPHGEFLDATEGIGGGVVDAFDVVGLYVDGKGGKG